MRNRIQTWFKHRFGVSPPALAIPAIAQWFSTTQGQALLYQQQAHIDESLSCLFGYHLCQLSVCPDITLFQASKIGHRFALGPCTGKSVGGRCDYRKLPLPAESIDVFLLHHALDFSQTPHQLLAEVAKATVPRGHIIIVGFNPWSLLGVWRYLLRILMRKPAVRQELLPLRRLQDWLTLLDLKVISVMQGYHLPTKRLHGAILKNGIWPFGGYYIITARKDIEGVTPIMPIKNWKKADLRAMPDRARARL